MLLLGSCNGKKNSNDGSTGIEPLTSTTKITVGTPQLEKKPQLLCRRSQAGAFLLCTLIHVIFYMHVIMYVCLRESLKYGHSLNCFMYQEKIRTKHRTWKCFRSISAQGIGTAYTIYTHDQRICDRKNIMHWQVEMTTLQCFFGIDVCILPIELRTWELVYLYAFDSSKP